MLVSLPHASAASSGDLEVIILHMLESYPRNPLSRVVLPCWKNRTIQLAVLFCTLFFVDQSKIVPLGLDTSCRL